MGGATCYCLRATGSFSNVPPVHGPSPNRKPLRLSCRRRRTALEPSHSRTDAGG